MYLWGFLKAWEIQESSFTSEEAWSLVIDCVAHILKELHSARLVVVGAGKYN